MSVVVVSAADIAEFHGSQNPSYAVFFADREFTDSTGVIVAKGNVRKPAFGQRFDVDVVGNKIRVMSGNLYSTTDSSDPTATYSLIVFDDKNKPIGDPVFSNLRVPASLTPLTLDYLRIFSAAKKVCDAPTFLTAELIYELLAGLELAPLASDAIYGRSRLSFPAQTLSDPIAVGAYDPTYRGLGVPFQFKKFTSLAEAVTTITGLVGTGPAELVFTDPFTHSGSSYNIPTNIVCRFVGAGKLTVSNNSSIVTLNLGPTPIRQIFAGGGKVLVKTPTDLWVDWWADMTAVNHTHAVQQAVDSCYQVGVLGGKVRFTVQDYYFDGIVLTQPIIFEGSGNGSDMASFEGAVREGTTCHLVAGSGNTKIISVHATGSDGEPRNITVSHMGFNIGATGTANCIYVGGVQGTGTSYLFHIDRCSFVGTSTANQTLVWWDGDESGLGWESIGNNISGCYMTCPRNGTGFKMQTENSSFVFSANTVVGGLGTSTCYDFIRVGWTLVLNPDSRGPFGGTYGSTPTTAWRSLTGDISPSDQYTAGGGTDLIHSKFTLTDPSDSFWANDLGKAFTDRPTGWSVDGAYITSILSPTEALLSFHPDSYGSSTGVTLDLKSWSYPQDIAGTVFKLHGNFTQINIINGADEGFNYSFDIGAGQYSGQFAVSGYSAQGKTVFNASINAKFTDCRMFSLSFEDRAAPGLPIVETHGCYFYRSTVYPGVVIDTANPWGYSNQLTKWTDFGSTFEYTDNFVDDSTIPAIGINKRHHIENQLQIRKCDYGNDQPRSKAMVSIGHTAFNQTPDLEDQVAFEIGVIRPSPDGVFSQFPVEGDLLDPYQILQHTYDWGLDLRCNSSFRKLRTYMPVYLMEGAILDAAQTLFANGDVKAAKILAVNTKADKTHGTGYDTGAGGSVTQATNRNTAVTLNAQCGEITTTSETLTNGTAATFKVNNSCFSQHDKPEISLEYAGAPSSAIRCEVFYPHGGRDGSFYITYRNTSGADEGSPYLIKFWKGKSVIT